MAEKKILIIEDNPLNMKLFYDLLSAEDYGSIYKATTGKEALNILKKEIPDLIVLDMRLPDMTGVDIYNHIKSDNRLINVKVFVVTASATSEDIEKYKLEDFDSFMTKPIDISKFTNIVKELLGL